MENLLLSLDSLFSWSFFFANLIPVGYVIPSLILHMHGVIFECEFISKKRTKERKISFFPPDSSVNMFPSISLLCGFPHGAIIRDPFCKVAHLLSIVGLSITQAFLLCKLPTVT